MVKRMSYLNERLSGIPETEPIFPFPPGGRGSGRTEWMIGELIDAVKQGQPLSVVISHNLHFSRYLIDRFLVKSALAHLPVSRVRNLCCISCASLIEFTSLEVYEQGKRFDNFGVFVDHFVDEVEYERR